MDPYPSLTSRQTGRGLFALILTLLTSAGTPSARAEDDPHLLMGNPSHAKADERDKDNYLLKKKYFALSYNNDRGTPNWVSWHLHKSDLGDAPRKPFVADNDLPPGFKKVFTRDYTKAGFNRGHMCPHSDRDKTDAASAATFVMTNIIPQSSENNQGAWNQLEMYCRSLVEDKGKELYIVCGPHGRGGWGDFGFRTTLANGKITVPAKTWKVILVLDEGTDDLRRVNEHTRLIAVVMPNDTSVPLDWARYRVAVKDVEELTGYKFFDHVAPQIIDPLKEEADAVPIPRARRGPRDN